MVKGFFKKMFEGGKKATKRRTAGTSRLLKATGVISGKASRAGAGRPKGSYKYKIGGRSVSVFEYRRFLAQRKQQLSQFQRQQNQRLASKGFTEEQIQALRQQKAVQQARQGGPIMKENIADQEADFQEFLARNTVSPKTQQMLVAIRRIQNKGKIDNIEQQRRHHERRLVGDQMNLMKAHENMNHIKLDFTGVSTDNILTAPNAFKEDPINNPPILKQTRLSLLDTKGAGNDLKF